MRIFACKFAKVMMASLRQLFLKHLAPTSALPLLFEVQRAEGLYLYDDQGRAHIDLIAGIGVSALGHRHPRVLAAIQDQCERYLHTMVYGEYVLAPQVELAQLLAEQLPDPLDSVYLVNSGTEATEGAMKLAKRYTGRAEIVACYNAYHGSTQGALSLMNSEVFTQPFRPLLPGIRHIEFNDPADLSTITTQTAAVVAETVQAEWGVRRPENGYLKALRQRCDETGTLLILDEIQAGMGRTGSLFAFEQYGIVPDILLLAKGLGGGMPIGAFVAAREVMAALSFDPILGHITTFGGHPVSAAAALATVRELVESDLIQRVAQKSDRFVELLQHPSIRQVRRAGLLMAVQLDDFDQVQKVIARCIAKGLITDWFLFNDRSLRIAPPLIIEDEQFQTACQIILEALDEVAREAA